MDEHIFEIRLWHGGGHRPFERWYSVEEPKYLDHGAVRFICVDGFEHYLSGNIQVSQRPKRRETDRNADS